MQTENYNTTTHKKKYNYNRVTEKLVVPIIALFTHSRVSHKMDIFFYGLACHPSRFLAPKTSLSKNSGQSEDLDFLWFQRLHVDR